MKGSRQNCCNFVPLRDISHAQAAAEQPCVYAVARLPSNQLVASRMTACVVLAAETAALGGYLLYVAPLMPDCLPQTIVLCTLVTISYYLHYRCLSLHIQM